MNPDDSLSHAEQQNDEVPPKTTPLPSSPAHDLLADLLSNPETTKPDNSYRSIGGGWAKWR